MVLSSRDHGATRAQRAPRPTVAEGARRPLAVALLALALASPSLNAHGLMPLLVTALIMLAALRWAIPPLVRWAVADAPQASAEPQPARRHGKPSCH